MSTTRHGATLRTMSGSVLAGLRAGLGAASAGTVRGAGSPVLPTTVSSAATIGLRTWLPHAARMALVAGGSSWRWSWH